MTTLDNLIILGDFNINTEDITNAENTIFNDTRIAFGCKQHLQGPMHRLGNMLNLIFTQIIFMPRNDCSFFLVNRGRISASTLSLWGPAVHCIWILFH